MALKGNESTKVILFCGLSNAGKTTILNIFTKGDVFKTRPTLGVSLDTMSFEDINFRIFDLGGQEKFRDEIIHLLPFTNIVVFVVDSADKKNIPEARRELQRILRETELKLTPICVLGNKIDLKNSIPIDKLTKELGLDRLFDRPWNILGTSAVTLDGLTDLFKWIYQQSVGKIPEFKIEKKEEKKWSFYAPCPMMREIEHGATFCMNQDGFEETELMSFGLSEEISRMVLKVIPELRKESLENKGKDICPDFCILSKNKGVLQCPVSKLEITTRGIKVTLRRYEDALTLSQIYGAKSGEDVCRECFYKIIISSEVILGSKEIEYLSDSKWSRT